MAYFAPRPTAPPSPMPTRETYTRTRGGSGSAAYPQGGRNIPAVPSVAETAAERQQRWNRERFLRVAQAETTLRNISGVYDAANAPLLGQLNKSIEDARRVNLANQTAYNQSANLARQGTNIDVMGAAIDEQLAKADLGQIAELLNLNNQSFGNALNVGKTKLDRATELDKFAQSTRTIDLQDIMNQRANVAEEKRLADFNVSGKAGAESGVASGAARMGFKANTTAANIAGEKINVLDATSSQRLQEALASNKFDRDMVNWDLQQAGINRREKELDIQSRQRALDAQAKKAGLSRKQYEIALQQKLNELNLSRITSVGAMADAISKGKIAGLEVARQTAGQLAANPQAAAAAATKARGGKLPPRRG